MKSFYSKRLNMKTHIVLIAILTAFLIITVQTAAPANSLRIISEDSTEIVFQYEIPSYSVVKEMQENGFESSKIVIPDTVDMYEIGEPVLPKKSFLIAIPDKIIPKIKILEKEFDELRDIRIPLQKNADSDYESRKLKKELSNIDETFSSNILIYPSKSVEVEDTAFIRNQKVARISIYPASYSSKNYVVKLLKKIRFKVIFVKDLGSSRHVGNKEEGIARGRNQIFDSIISSSVMNQYIPMENSGKESLTPSYKKINPSEFILKITTREKGIYIITYQDFKKMQYIPESIDPRSLRVFHKDEEIPAYIKGEDDGEFNSNDFLIFYADEVVSEYTRNNKYFLKYGNVNGLRMKSAEGTPLDSENAVLKFKNKIHFEESIEYIKYSFGDNSDHWYWSKLTPEVKKNIPFTISNPSQDGDNVSITVNFRGFTYNYSDTANHHAKVAINGVVSLGDAYFVGQDEFAAEYIISDTNLFDGDNYLTVENPGDTDAPGYLDIFLFDSFDLEFKQKLLAISDELEFISAGINKDTFETGGFSNGDIWAFNITDAESPEIITGTVIKSYLDANQYNRYKIYFSDLSDEQKIFYLLSDGQFRKPLKIAPAGNSNLKDESNGADYLVITHDKFFNTVKSLVKFRKKLGLKSKAVKVSDIYEEFGGGIPDAHAIKEFIKYTYEHWDPVPTFVLLVGDTVIDYKNYLGYGRKSYIPAKLLDSRFEAEYPSDSWFVEVNGDDILPDMLIGRIPANNSAEIKEVIKKIKKYENGGYAKDWQKNIIFVADNNGTEFEDALNFLNYTYVPSDFNVKKIYLSGYSDCTNDDCSVVTDDILKSINDGALITIYSGHGNVNNWAGELALETSDIDGLKSGGENTFMVALNCNNGYFVRLGEEFSLGEKVVMAGRKGRKGRKGAIGSFVSSGLGYSGEHKILSQELFSLIFKDNENQIGYLTTEAKISSYVRGISDEIIKFFLLFGDPAIRLRINPVRIIPASPLNGDEVSKLQKKNLNFSWLAPSGFKFRLQFSRDKSFSDKYDIMIPFRGWIKSKNKSVGVKEISAIDKMIEDNNGTLFWRIKGISGSGVDRKILFSKPRKLR